MDRQIVYPGSIPLDTDLLNTQLNAMIALGFLARATLGTSTVCDGLGALPTIPASMSITLNPGSITSLATVDATAYGSLPSNAAALVKLGINGLATTLTFVAPATVGQSQNFLIEASFSESDAIPVALPYYNAANPAVSFSGPGNSGVPQNTKRLQSVAIQVKPGAPASAGSQATPSADAGWFPLYIVTLNAGQVSITSSSIATHPAAPFLAFKLPQLNPGFSRIQTFTSGGTFVPPLGCNAVKVRVWAGGGGGGGSQGANSGGSSGAGGGYSEGVVNVSPGISIPVSVGAAGAAGAITGGAPNGTGGGGGSSAFGSAITATGGNGGAGANGAFQTAAPSGGSGSGGAFNTQGTNGSTPYSVGSSVVVAQGGGTFGTSIAPANFVGTAVAVSPGVYPGGGGNGGALGGMGAAGANGVVIVEY